jgi:hypothetical protein
MRKVSGEIMPAGRPTDYTPELGSDICGLIIEGYTLRQVAAKDGMPTKAAICRWLAKHEEFRDLYARAREFQAEHMADETLEIADDATNDWMVREGKSGDDTVFAINGEHVQRSRLRVDTRKWLMSKLAPKKYGDKITQEHDVTDKAAEALKPSEQDLARSVAFILAKGVAASNG